MNKQLKRKGFISCVEIVAQEVKEELTNNKNQSLAHGWEHALGVRNIALDISKQMKFESGVKIDEELLEITALTHDFDQSYLCNKKSHIDKSIKKTKNLLKKIGYPEERIKLVLQINSEHSSEDIKESSTIESAILYDADKINGIGVVGIKRVLIYGKQRGWSQRKTLEWYERKYKKAIDNMKTDIGRSMVKETEEYMRNFFQSAEKQIYFNTKGD